MPRNSNGTYALPSGNPVSPSTLIESLWANTTLADVGQALTESLDRYGRGTMLAAFRVADGTVTAPGVAFGSEASTGIYRSGAGVLGLSVLGVAKATITAAAFTFNTAPTWAADPASGNQLTRKTYVDSAIATAGGAFLPLAGGTLTGALNVGIAGTAAAPALRINDDNTGLYQVAANEIGFATGGIHRVTINVSGISGAGGGLTALNASNLSTGTVPDARISGAYTGLTNITASGTVAAANVTASSAMTAATFNGSGSGLTGLNASNLSSGTVADARISGSYTGLVNLTLSGDIMMPSPTADIFTTIATSRLQLTGGSTSASGGRIILYGEGHASLPDRVALYGSATQYASFSLSGMELATGVFSGNGSSLTALNASQLTSGTVPDARISGAYSGITNLTASGIIGAGGAYLNGAASAGIQLALSLGASTAGVLGNGSRVSMMAGAANFGSATRGVYLDAANRSGASNSHEFRILTSDSAAEPSLSATFNVLGLTLGKGAFIGDGSGLTALNASNLSSGTVADARISGAYTGISTLTLTDQLRLPAGTGAAPSLRWLGDTDTGIYSPGVALVAVSISGVDRLTVAGGLTSIIGALDVSAGITGATFTGSGSGLTALNASNLSSGTVPNARISGAYSGITTLAATSITATSQFLAPDGTTSVPGFAFSADSNTGIYRFAENDLRITCGGQAVMSFAIGAITAVSSTDIVMGVATDPTSTGSVGYRGMPVTTINATTAFILSEAGQTRRKSNTTAYTWTINPDATTNFPIGTVIFLLHDSTAGNITVARGAGVALVEGTTDANATLSAGERASIHKVAANRWRIYR